MAGRPKRFDFLHGFRFHVNVIIPNSAVQNLQSDFGANGNISAGFNACSAPSASNEAVEYREGHFIYTKKYVGLPTVTDITLSRGVALTDGTMWLWMKDVIEGNAEYRADMLIYHFHRDAKNATQINATNENMNPDPSAQGFVLYKCGNVFPTEHKVAGDFDATSSEVSIQELTVAIEHFDTELHPQP